MKKIYSDLKNWYIYFSKTLGQSKFKFFLHFAFFGQNYNFCKFVQNFGWFQHFFMNILSWGSGETFKKKLVLVTKMEKFMFFYKQHFFNTFTRTRLVGTTVYATEKIPENH